MALLSGAGLSVHPEKSRFSSLSTEERRISWRERIRKAAFILPCYETLEKWIYPNNGNFLCRTNLVNLQSKCWKQCSLCIFLTCRVFIVFIHSLCCLLPYYNNNNTHTWSDLPLSKKHLSQSFLREALVSSWSPLHNILYLEPVRALLVLSASFSCGAKEEDSDLTWKWHLTRRTRTDLHSQYLFLRISFLSKKFTCSFKNLISSSSSSSALPT